MSDEMVPGLGDTPEGPRRAAAARPRRTGRRVLLVLGVLLLVLGLAGGGLLWLASNALNKATGGRGGSPIGIFVPLPLSDEDSGITNVLIAGNAFDDPGHDGAGLTDSIIVASINVKKNTTSLISVPRDLWVDHNGRQSKINAVYVYAGGGEAGMTALSEAVSKVTGLRIDQHVLVGFVAVREIVDAVGGVDVVIKSPDPRGIADAGIKLSNGPHHLDGETALRLARARNSDGTNDGSYGLPGGDFDRQKNQRMLIAALVDKVRRTPALANPLAVVTIFNSLGNNINTNLNAGQLRRFVDLVGDTPQESVSLRGKPGQSLLVNYRGPGGAAALAPAAGLFEYGPIQAFVAETVGQER